MGESHAEFAERTVDILESKIDSLQETLYKEKLNYRLRQQFFFYFVILSLFRAISEQLDKTLKMMMDMWLLFSLVCKGKVIRKYKCPNVNGKK